MTPRDHHHHQQPTTTTTVLIGNGLRDNESQSSTALLSKSRARGRSISFHPKVRVVDHIHLNDYSVQEQSRCWSSPEELQDIRSQIESTLQTMLDGVTHSYDTQDGDDNGDDDEITCTRGLERFMPVSSRTRRCRRQQAVDSVLEYQYAMWETGYGELDDDFVAQIYARYTDRSAHMAHMLGLWDARQVETPERRHQRRIGRGQRPLLCQRRGNAWNCERKLYQRHKTHSI